MTALDRIRKSQQLLNKAEREGRQASPAVLEQVVEDLGNAARSLAELRRDMRSPQTPLDAETIAAARQVCAACERLKILFQSGEEYCNSLIRVLSVPRSGYTETGVAPILHLHGVIAVEG